MPPKRRADGDHVGRSKAVAGDGDENGYLDEDSGLVFEDPFGDEFEEEEVIDAQGDVDDDDEDMDVDDTNEGDTGAETSQLAQKQVWRPGIDELEEGETLECDPSAYVMYHSLKMDWPCLSFDIMRDAYGEGRHRVSFVYIFVHFLY